MAFVQYGHLTEAEREHQRHQNELQDELKRLGEVQSLIVLKLSIALRGGLTRDLREQIEGAAASYGEAFSRLMAACPVRVEKLQISRGK
jgi:hypothetical protein